MIRTSPGSVVIPSEGSSYRSPGSSSKSSSTTSRAVIPLSWFVDRMLSASVQFQFEFALSEPPHRLLLPSGGSSMPHSCMGLIHDRREMVVWDLFDWVLISSSSAAVVKISVHPSPDTEDAVKDSSSVSGNADGESKAWLRAWSRSGPDRGAASDERITSSRRTRVPSN